MNIAFPSLREFALSIVSLHFQSRFSQFSVVLLMCRSYSRPPSLAPLPPHRLPAFTLSRLID